MKTLNINGEAGLFFLKNKFPNLSEAKIREGIFDESQIWQLMPWMWFRKELDWTWETNMVVCESCQTISWETQNLENTSIWSLTCCKTSRKWKWTCHWKPLLFRVFISFSKLSRNSTRYQKNMPTVRFCIKRCIKIIYCFSHKKNCLQHFISWFVIFQKKSLIRKISKTWCFGKKWRPDSNSAQKTTLKMTYLILWAHRSLLSTSVIDNTIKLFSKFLL